MSCMGLENTEMIHIVYFALVTGRMLPLMTINLTFITNGFGSKIKKDLEYQKHHQHTKHCSSVFIETKINKSCKPCKDFLSLIFLGTLVLVGLN